MPQFMVLAEYYKDAAVLHRRMYSREAHLERLRLEKTKGIFIIGGAQLDAAGQAIGSMLLLELPDANAVRYWLNPDPYVTGKVWEHLRIVPFAVAAV